MLPSDGPTKPGAGRSSSRDGSASEPDGTVRRDSAIATGQAEWLPQIPEGLEPLVPNPGGIGDPDALVGREVELTRLMEAVSAGGAHVTGERRMGKTWLVKKLQDELADSVTAIYVSAETDNLSLFEDRLLAELRRNRMVKETIHRWGLDFGGKLQLKILKSGITLTGHAQRAAGTGDQELDVLDLLASQPRGPVVLIIDEITHLCRHLGPEAAGEFLSGLRARRQSGGVPLVISGSIGLHHALANLRPVNDLWTVMVGPLTRDDAATLAARLLLGIGVPPEPTLVVDIVRQTSGIPFYIQAVVDQFRYRGDCDVTAVVDQCIASDVWQTRDYVERLKLYYGADDARRARVVLDLIATADRPVSAETISARLEIDGGGLATDWDDLLHLLDNLERDHYLVRDGEGDRMSSTLLARIWRHHRRLA